jgi:mono/diheme cytochrome c family protein
MRARTFVLLSLIVVVLIGVGVWTASGLRGLSTRPEPSWIERVVARSARRLATPRDARQRANPVTFSDEVWAEARAHFADHCAACHANDGSGQTEMGRNLYPRAPDMRLRDTQQLSDGELYWIIENGVRLTGMPAWGTGGDDDMDTWKLVHFIRRLRDLTPAQIKEMEALNPKSPAELQEEREDDRFLAGDDAVADPHHSHKETP